MDRFWASNKYKGFLEVLSRNYFISLASKQGVKIVFSGYVDDRYGAYPCVKFQDGVKEVWIKYGMGISQRFIPIHSLYQNLRKVLSVHS